VLFGADGNDSITGGVGFDRVNGNKGDDVILGHSQTGDWLLGGQGNDVVNAFQSTGHNILNGNIGADTLFGGLGGDTLHAVQQAWLGQQVPQCGYCQSGMIMAVAAFLSEHPKPTDQDIDAGITNICRCGTFARVRRAIHAVAEG